VDLPLSDEGAPLQMAGTRDEISISKILADLGGFGCRDLCVISLALPKLPFGYGQEQIALLDAVKVFNVSLCPREPATRLPSVPSEQEIQA
jgi:hypothetical protein